MKKILGLDLGTNSIGWALVENDFDSKSGKILGMGSRIIPMSQDILGNFDSGNSVSQTAERTGYRGTRRLRERNLLRRERLHRVLNVLGFLPEHYANQIDFEKHLGQFLDEKEPKLAWKQNENGKFEFLFHKSFTEMVEDFKANGQDIKIPYDWTIYYLRKKALTKKIEKEELAWLILNYNQKRGYYQLRGEEEEDATKTAKTRKYFDRQVIKNIVDTNEIYKGLKVLLVELENGSKGKIFKKEIPQWIGLEKNIIATVDIDKDGNDRYEENGLLSQRFSIPTDAEWETEWKLIKLKTEKDLRDSGKTVGTYIYETLLQNPTQKIRGKLVRTIERKFYKDELIAILKKQVELQPELFTEDLYNDCARELYRSNEAHQSELTKRNDFVLLFVNDIIFYQRPLKSQKSSIGNCGLEYNKHKINKKDEKGNPIKNVFEKDANGKDIEIKEYLKGIPKSNPYYQEFRVWQWLYNLKIYLREDDKDVTTDFLKNADDYVSLFDFLMSRKKIDNKALITYFLNLQGIKGKNADKELKKYRWNYVFDNSKDKEENKSKEYPCNKTGSHIKTRLEKVENVPADFLKIIDKKEVEIKKGKDKGKKIIVSLGTREYQLWNIIHSVTDINEFKTALGKFAQKYNLDETSFVENFKNLVFEENDYGSFSEKAIKKLLPLMRLGKYWNENEISETVKERANSIKERLDNIDYDEKLLEGVADDDVMKRVLKSFIKQKNLSFISGLQLYQASYLVYGRHSEAENVNTWKMSYDIQDYLYEFRQHSLRNPIVEQIITETLRVVKDIWEHYALENNVECVEIYDEKKKKNVKSFGKFFDEIHIELGREMKNTAEDRAKMTNQVSDNENTNLRIKAMLMEFAEDDFFKTKIEKDDGSIVTINPVRPYSQNQQDILKIYEEDVLRKYSEQELKNEKTELKDKEGKEITIYNISKKSTPTDKEIQKYKLWLEQKYRSPYTGQMISLSRLFTADYEIEHIIPQSRYFDDSLSNKVICEAAVNKLKDRYLGFEFIKKHAGEKVECGMGKVVEIFTEDSYTEFVKEHYKNNNAKRKKLLLEEIPDKMIDRQLNDTRHISKFVSKLLSNIVREEKDDDGVNSKNLISGNGKITSTLKQNWGLNEVWNALILPRFERMNELKNTESFTSKNTEGHTIPAIPMELSKGFQKKRIDHRHHALDALIIACMTREHVQYLNNENAKSQKFHLQKGLAKTLRKYETIEKTIQEKDENGVWRIKIDENGKQITKPIEVPKEYFMPWGNFVVDVKEKLEKIVISFKQNLRVINKTKFAGLTYKESKEKSNNQNWAIRKQLHEETVSGIVNLPWVKLGKGEVTMATRKALDASYSENKIKKITDTGIQKILINYLSSKNNDTELAFSPEGIEEMNKNIAQYNEGKFHQPILKVRIYEKGKGRFVLGSTGNKKSKYVQGAPNLFFAIYADENGNRSYETIPLNIVIERLKQGLKEVPDMNEKGHKLLFYLSPNDLVYIPTEDEKENIRAIDWKNLDKEQLKRIYKMVSSSGSQCFFVQQLVANSIVNKVEFSALNKMEKNIENVMIKEVCIKLNIDRLGNIKT